MKHLISRLLQGPKKMKYGPELRSFAMTLHFYSPKAYQYVRQKFNKTLPHPITISKWYSSVNGQPGFTEEAKHALKVKVEEASLRGYQIICSLVFDEISIRKQVEWDGHHYHGFVDIGSKIDSDSIPQASEALVIMLVGINACWKVPLGYFFTNGLTGVEKANLIIRALEFVNDMDIIISNVTCDGLHSNFQMATALGANFSDTDNLKTYFEHPIQKYKIYVILDPSHMIKLIRNCFGCYQNLENGEGKQICWQYLKYLVDVQTTEGLNVANKFKNRHIQFFREKMKVKLASQTLSKSVADGLGFLREDVREPEINTKFAGSEATEEFLLLFNDCFDIMNSCSQYSTYKFKRALSASTSGYIFDRLLDIKKYISSLKYAGRSILLSGRKCGFLGMLINIESILGLYHHFIASEMPKLKYLLTYKLSQDHLEIFFSAIRSRGGNNNNPTAKQFQAAYKKLLIHIEVKGADSGNATAIDATSVLHCSSANRKSTETADGDDLTASEPHMQIEQLVQEMDFINSPVWHLTTYSEDVVKYISGFVGRSLSKCVVCDDCVKALISSNIDSYLQKRKTFDNAKMFSPSELLIKMCMLGEKTFRVYYNKINIFDSRNKNLLQVLINSSFRNLPANIMNYFGSHVLDFEPLSSHFTDLLKLILKKYFNIRIHHETRKRLDNNIGNRVRSILTKTILFKNQ
ncbi:unnamed protein product [Callosobruchus maculatus]|uniref:THAP domain-containing protein 9 n=1 Tax=Callosobruchus maculatus TaxID=64391 RepID=A0A653C6T0_CALMS|nr:unnamed protein product [Callosobruchus maculatus]